jgi:hypothetical protein
MVLRFTAHFRRNYFAAGVVAIFVLLSSVDSRVSAGELILQINSILDSNLYLHDIFLSSAEKFNARYYLVHILAELTRLLHLSPDIFLSFLNRVVHFSIYYTFYLIAQHISGSSWVGLCALLVNIVFTLLSFDFASFSLWSGQINAQSFFYLLYFLSIYVCFKGNLNFGLILIGVASLFHFLLGVIYFFFLVLSLVILSYHNSNTLNPSLRILHLFPGFLVGSILILFSLIPFIFFNDLSSLLTSKEYVDIYIYERHPHHYLLSSFTLLEWLFLCCAFVSSAILVKQYFQTRNKDLIFILTPFFCSICLLPVFYWFVEIYPSKLISGLSITRFVSHTGLIVLSIALGNTIAKKTYNFKYMIQHKGLETVVMPGLALLLVCSIFYDVNSRNITKFDYVKYDLLQMHPPESYLKHLDLIKACDWIQVSSLVTDMMISPNTEARYLCRRSMLGGGSFPFVNNDQLILKWNNETKYASTFYATVESGMNCKDLLQSKANIIILPSKINPLFSYAYRNDSFQVLFRDNQKC